MAITENSNANRLNMIPTHSHCPDHTIPSQAFSSRAGRVFISAECT
jgi:hypothetical protein